MTDRKTFDLQPDPGARTIVAGDAVHEMNVRLTIDESMTVVAVEVAMDATPYQICNNIEAAFQVLTGEQIGAGWRQMIKNKLGGVRGCTHVVELLAPVATTAYQCLYKVLHQKTGLVPLDGCHAWATSGALVQQHYPKFYKNPAS